MTMEMSIIRPQKRLIRDNHVPPICSFLAFFRFRSELTDGKLYFSVTQLDFDLN